MRAFLRWFVRRGMIESDPLRHVQASTVTRGRGYRRALTPEQFRGFLASVPVHRATVYLTAYYLGLRRAELNRLRRADFDLDAARPSVRIPGSVSKNRRAAQFGLRPELVAALRAFWPADMAPFAFAFHGRVPNMDTWKRDLARAGIAIVDTDGRRFDFHALRTMLCTHLHASGRVGLRQAMAIMRHTDARLTMQDYTDDERIAVDDGMSALPSFALQNGQGGLKHGS